MIDRREPTAGEWNKMSSAPNLDGKMENLDGTMNFGRFFEQKVIPLERSGVQVFQMESPDGPLKMINAKVKITDHIVGKPSNTSLLFCCYKLTRLFGWQHRCAWGG